MDICAPSLTWSKMGVQQSTIANVLRSYNWSCSRFTGHLLSTQGRSDFDKLTGKMTSEPNLLRPMRPATHPTTHWRSRQGRRHRQRRSRDNEQTSLVPSPQDDSTASNSDSASNPCNKHRQGRNRHDRTERRKRARNAKSLQRWY